MFNFGAIATVLIISVLLAVSGIKILKEYERAVIFRLGRLVRARGSGIHRAITAKEASYSLPAAGRVGGNL
jgi:regulator of protease activity HflC (stomatin/prohibitin superfamily)